MRWNTTCRSSPPFPSVLSLQSLPYSLSNCQCAQQGRHAFNCRYGVFYLDKCLSPVYLSTSFSSLHLPCNLSSYQKPTANQKLQHIRPPQPSSPFRKIDTSHTPQTQPRSKNPTLIRQDLFNRQFTNLHNSREMFASLFPVLKPQYINHATSTSHPRFQICCTSPCRGDPDLAIP